MLPCTAVLLIIAAPPTVSVSGPLTFPGGGLVAARDVYPGVPPSVEFDGSSFLVTWEDSRSTRQDLWAMRVSPNGARIDPTGFLAAPSLFEHQLACGPGHCLAVWGAQGKLSAVVISAGTPGAVFSVTLGSNPIFRGVAWNGVHYVVVARELSSTQGWFVRITPAGQVLDVGGRPLTIGSYDVGLACLPGHCLMTIATSTGRIEGTFIDDVTVSPIAAIRTGNVVRTDVAVGSGGGGFLVAWAEGPNVSSDVYAATVSAAGSSGTAVLLTGAANRQALPRMTYAGNVFVVAWQDARTGGPNVYGARVDGAGQVLDPGGVALSPGPAYQQGLGSDGTRALLAVSEAGGGALRLIGRLLSPGGLTADGGVLLSQGQAAQTDALLERVDGGVLLAWQEPQDTDSEVHVARLDLDGRTVVNRAVAAGTAPGLACGPGACMVTYASDAGVTWRRVSPGDGAPLDVPRATPTVARAGSTAVAYTGTQWALTFTDFYQVELLRLGLTGIPRDPTPILLGSSGGVVTRARIVSSPPNLAVSWSDDDVMGSSRALRVVDEEAPSDGGFRFPQSLPAIAYGEPETLLPRDGGFFVTLATYTLDGGTGQHALLLDLQGTEVPPRRFFARSAGPENGSTAFDGKYVLTAWGYLRADQRFDVSGAILDLSGALIAGPFPIATGPGDEVRAVVVAAAPSRFAVAYEELDETPGVGARRLRVRWVTLDGATTDGGCNSNVDCESFACIAGTCRPPGTDGGLPVWDAGLEPDGGTTLPDGGMPLPDDGGTLPDDGGTALPDGGTTLPDGGVPGPGHYRVGCGCGAAPDLTVALLGLALALQRRRARRVRASRRASSGTSR